MTKLQCIKTDCTFNVTGRCLESHEKAGECPNVAPVIDVLPEERKPPKPIVTAPTLRQFHQGFELGFNEAHSLMRGSYVHIVGILGAQNVGKTCLLTSLYLRAATRLLRPKYTFAGSLTLQGFEHRARHLRRWNPEGIPERIVDRTVLSDPRRPAFVHLALESQDSASRRVELLFSDLPGEWSSSLINRADVASRFEFLSRADAVALIVDGPNLVSNATRHLETINAKHLLGRLAHNVNLPRDVRLLLVVSKFDQLDGLPADLRQIEEEAERLGFKPKVIPIAAFSRRTAVVPHGTGVLEFVDAITEPFELTDRRPTAADILSERSFSRRSGCAV